MRLVVRTDVLVKFGVNAGPGVLSLGLDPYRACELRPFLQLGTDESLERFRGAADRLGAYRGET